MLWAERITSLPVRIKEQKRTAMFYSFTGTCKMHGIEPMAWLTAVLGEIADHPANKLHELFPQNLTIPEKLSNFGELEN